MCKRRGIHSAESVLNSVVSRVGGCLALRALLEVPDPDYRVGTPCSYGAAVGRDGGTIKRSVRVGEGIEADRWRDVCSHSDAIADILLTLCLKLLISVT